MTKTIRTIDRGLKVAKWFVIGLITLYAIDAAGALALMILNAI